MSSSLIFKLLLSEMVIGTIVLIFLSNLNKHILY